jgi:hypothetical protein
MSNEARKLRRARFKLILVFILFLAPAPLAWLAHQFWKPTRFTNYGTLIDPTALHDAPSAREGGKPFSWTSLKGHWVMVEVHDGACDADCVRKLYLMRQIRLTQGRDKDRIERLALVPSDEPELPAGYEGTRVVENATGLVSQFPAPVDPGLHIFLVDPMGRLMMRFPENPEPKKVISDIRRLLKYTWVEGK